MTSRVHLVSPPLQHRREPSALMDVSLPLVKDISFMMQRGFYHTFTSTPFCIILAALLFRMADLASRPLMAVSDLPMKMQHGFTTMWVMVQRWLCIDALFARQQTSKLKIVEPLRRNTICAPPFLYKVGVKFDESQRDSLCYILKIKS